MLKLKSLFSILSISLLTTHSFAATEFESSIPIELVKALLTNPSTTETRIYTDILDEFPEFQIPIGFEVLGSVDQRHIQRVVLTTELEEDEAVLQIIAAFEDVDFVRFDLRSPRVNENGFVSPEPRRLARQMCHDDIGNLSFSFIEVNNIRLVSLSASIYRNTNQLTCAQQAQQYQMSMLRMG
ncbi:MAG: hypothetical protein IIB77_06485, partial [Proteobacteria bacterium]|nr:hypothetical protein [Pseudomonadota bacterium]